MKNLCVLLRLCGEIWLAALVAALPRYASRSFLIFSKPKLIVSFSKTPSMHQAAQFALP
jgi:hypothetical protein